MAKTDNGVVSEPFSGGNLRYYISWRDARTSPQLFLEMGRGFLKKKQKRLHVVKAMPLQKVSLSLGVAVTETFKQQRFCRQAVNKLSLKGFQEVKWPAFGSNKCNITSRKMYLRRRRSKK